MVAFFAATPSPVGATLGGGNCVGTAAPGCAYVDESGVSMRGYGYQYDYAGDAVNYDVKVSYTGLREWTGSIWQTITYSTNSTWQFDSSTLASIWLGCDAGWTYTSQITRNWRSASDSGSGTVYSNGVVC
jgi:hypothetical protein